MLWIKRRLGRNGVKAEEFAVRLRLSLALRQHNENCLLEH